MSKGYHPTDDAHAWMRYQPLGIRPMYPVIHRGCGIRAERMTFWQWVRAICPRFFR